jgi:quercetin dioxygenase-like cupin family protein
MTVTRPASGTRARWNPFTHLLLLAGTFLVVGGTIAGCSPPPATPEPGTPTEKTTPVTSDDQHSTVASAQPSDALAGRLKRTEIQRSASSIPGRDIVQVLTEIPVGVESGWHTHPGEEVGYILAGNVSMKIRDRPTLTLHTGDGFLIPPGTSHNALDIGQDTGKMLSTYIVDPNQPLATFTE